MIAYHFVADTLRNGDPIPPDGEWLEHTGEIVMCVSGLHASRHPLDALMYAPGATLCLVEVDGEIIEDADKLVASRRRIIARRDVTAMLHEFARAQALSVIHLWDAPDVVRQFLTTGDGTLRAAARAAAWAAWAAWAAARDATWAAGDVTWDAASAAWAAAWAAARDAARDAAWDAAWAARDAAGDATWDATWAAVWASRAAAWASARDDFEQRVNVLFADTALDAAGGM